jgi:enoyl-CoA hydratase
MSVVTFEKINGLIGLVRINRPDALNALNLEVRKKLSEIFLSLNFDDTVKVVILTGNEKAFAA